MTGKKADQNSAADKERHAERMKDQRDEIGVEVLAHEDRERRLFDGGEDVPHAA
jgi:hypothetical protein